VRLRALILIALTLVLAAPATAVADDIGLLRVLVTEARDSWPAPGLAARRHGALQRR
jgi:hypothetical protein